MPSSIRNLLFSVVLLLVGVLLGTLYLNARTNGLEKSHDWVTVLVVTREVPQGTAAKLLEKDGFVKPRRMLQMDESPGALDSISAHEARVVKAGMFPGDQVTTRKLASASDVNPATQMTGLLRHISMPIANWQAVNGKVHVGDTVDLFVGIKTTDGEAVVHTVSRNVTIVGVPAKVQARDQAKPSYVFEVPDKEVPRLIWAYAASHETGLHMVLIPRKGALESNLPKLMRGL